MRLFRMLEAQFQRVFGAGLYAVAAADAFWAVGGLAGVHAHPAGLDALAAMDAAVLVQIHAVEGEFVEQTVDGAQGAQVFAEGPPDDKAADHNQHQHRCLP